MNAAPVVALFCGSREWTDRERIRRDLESLPERSVVIEGGARGADRIAREEAQRLGLHVAIVPALWDHYGRSAGYRRNEAMARLEPDYVYAYSARRAGHRADDRHRRSRVHPGPRTMSAPVVHCKRAPYDIYIGRGRDPASRALGEWGNPYSHRPSSVPGVIVVPTVEEAIERYRRYLWAEIRSGRLPLDRLAALAGETLGCWCAPGPCHGEVLAAAATWAAAQLR